MLLFPTWHRKDDRNGLSREIESDAPGRRAASESATESEKRRATASAVGPKNVDVYSSAGELMEIGSYAIKKGYSKEVRLQFYLEFASLNQDDQNSSCKALEPEQFTPTLQSSRL